MRAQANTVVSSDGRVTIIVVGPGIVGGVTTLNETHPAFLRIADAIDRGEDPSPLLAPISATDVTGERITFVGNVLHFDGDPVYNGLSETILRYRTEGRDTAGLIKFMERLSANPSANSREQLFTWVTDKGLTIDPDGYLICYKGVSSSLLSMTAGSASVVEVDGTITDYEHTNIPNVPGTGVMMPRYNVQDNPGVGCSVGLHVGSWSYASRFGPVTMEVRVDPGDVVSVPQDCGYQKMRVCYYDVIAVHDMDKGDDLTDYEPEDETDFDEDEAMNAFMEYVPEGFFERVKARLRRKGAKV